MKIISSCDFKTKEKDQFIGVIVINYKMRPINMSRGIWPGCCVPLDEPLDLSPISEKEILYAYQRDSDFYFQSLDNKYCVVDNIDKKTLKEYKEYLETNQILNIIKVTRIKYWSIEKIKEYYVTNKEEAKMNYIGYELYGDYQIQERPWGDNLSISDIITSYISEDLLNDIHNDGIVFTEDFDYWDECKISNGIQVFNENDLEVIKETIRFLIQFITEEEKQKLRNVITDYYNKDLYTDEFGRDCWKNFIDINELGLGEK